MRRDKSIVQFYAAAVLWANNLTTTTTTMMMMMMMMMKEKKLGDIIADLEGVRRRLAERKVQFTASGVSTAHVPHSDDPATSQAMVELQHAPLDLCQRRWSASQREQQLGWSTTSESTASGGKLRYTSLQT